MAGGETRSAWHPAAALPLLLIVGPYYVNKFVYIAHPGDYPVFIATDYAVRLVTLVALLLVARAAPDAFVVPWRLTVTGVRDAVLAAAGTLILVVADVLTAPGKDWLDDLTGRLTHYPTPPGPTFAAIDNSFGMVLTGLSEEAIFRFYLINVLLWRGLTRRGALAGSTLLFAAIHWSYGGGSVAYAAFAGLVLALFYVSTRNLIVPVLVHIAVDIYYFTDTDVALRHLVW
ncbi:MAG TPA: CPBP family intramembrane glutamic endopeptidase [Candidatus Sulfotelmatobacter sp.]|nr:CPBP family intramembrane glutamic endopeptidase [Candidatus Sulfotelmatobacter sp.]